MKFLSKSTRISFLIPGRPIPKARPRTAFRGGRAITYNPAPSSHYAELARVVASNQYTKLKADPIPYPEPVKVTMKFTIPRKVTATPDLINLASQIADVLQGDRKHSPIAYNNDSQIVELHLFKVKGKYPVVEVTIEGLKEAGDIPQ